MTSDLLESGDLPMTMPLMKMSLLPPETINRQILREGWGLMNPPCTGNLNWDLLVFLGQYEENIYFCTTNDLCVRILSQAVEVFCDLSQICFMVSK